MFRQTRLSAFAVAVVMMTAPVALAMNSVRVQQRHDAEAVIDAALKKAMESQRDTESVRKQKQAGLSKMAAAHEDIIDIMHQKHAVRVQLAEQKAVATAFNEAYGVDPLHSEALIGFLEDQKNQLRALTWQYADATLAHQTLEQPMGITLIESLVDDSTVTASPDPDILYALLLQAQAIVLRRSRSVSDLSEAMLVLSAEHETLLESYHAAANEFDAGKDEVSLSEAQLQEIKREVLAAEAQVRAMQSSLQEYDERIRSKAERDLVAKGLLSIDALKQRSGKPKFIWPVEGRRISAGFFDKAYQRFFGVPHKAIDIPVPQGSAVVAAADGIVHYVRDAGYGYSYILIGHRDGYGTLYGHMSAMYVSAGQEVRRGEVIGLSGAMPGTRGAGLMTTGPHLHFEVSKDGVQINPQTVLP